MEDNSFQQFRTFFEPALIEELLQCEFVEMKPDAVLLGEGDFIREIPLLAKGVIKVRKTDDSGREILLYHIHPGESCILSITASLNESSSGAEAITEVPSKIILVSASKLKSWMDRYKTWRTFVMRLYYSRLTELLSLVDSIAFKHIDIRLMEKLQEKSAHGNGEIFITHQQLANELGTAREVISRLLKQLEKDHKIVISRGKIIITGQL
jgi:CRP/FNR family transcriptional regulator, anaerobic regulatory protein